MREYENNGDDAHFRLAHRSFRHHWPAAMLVGVALAGALVPRAVSASGGDRDHASR
jgi:hypothetical protein